MLHCIACVNLFFMLKQEPEFLLTAFAVILKPVYIKGSTDGVRGSIRSIMAAKRSQTSRFSVAFSGGNSEQQTVKQLREVFSRKHHVHCLKAVPGY